MTNRKLVITAIVYGTLLLGGCHRFGKSRSSFRSDTTPQSTTIPGVSGIVADLGSGYDPDHGRIMTARCIEGHVDENATLDELKIGKVSVEKNATANYIFGKLSGGVSGAFPVYPGINAGAQLQFATENSSTEVSYSIAISQSASRTQSLLEPYKVGQDFKRAAAGAHSSDAQAIRAAEKAKCGTEFVRDIHFGATVIAAITYRFDNASAKNSFASQFFIDLLGGIGHLQAEASIKSQSLRESFTVNIAVTQLGGNPEVLTQLFPDGLPRCRWQPSIANDENNEWLKPCRTAKDIIMGYASGSLPTDNPEAADILQRVVSFPQQLRQLNSQVSLSALVPLSYQTRPLSEFDWKNLEEIGSIPTSTRLNLTDNTQNTLLTALLNESLGIQAKEHLVRSSINYPRTARPASVGGTDSAQEDDSIFRLNHQTANIQLGRIHRYKSALIELELTCWQSPRDCRNWDLSAKLRDLQLRYPISLDFLESQPELSGFNSWCLAAGQNSLAADDLVSVNALLSFAGFPPVNSTNSELERNATCAAAANHLAGVSQITLGGNLAINSMRPIDNRTFSTTLDSIKLRDAKFNDFPLVFRIKSLRTLDLANNKIDASVANPGRLRDLPASLTTLDLSCLSHIAKDGGKALIPEQILANINVSKVIMRGHTISSLPIQQGVQELYLRTIHVNRDQLVELARQRRTPLRIYVQSFDGLSQTGARQDLKSNIAAPDQKVLILIDPNPVTCKP